MNLAKPQPHAPASTASQLDGGPSQTLPHHQQQLSCVEGTEQAGEPQSEVLRVVDLYSGIGGMHHALMRVLQAHQPGCSAGAEGPQLARACQGQNRCGAAAAPRGVRLQVTAVDINTLANRVYEAEFGVKPRTLDLHKITASQLDELAADLWLLTPPCQPYTTTRNARRRDMADPRAASLLHLLSDAVLPAMRHPPARLLLENVPGFVGSGSHQALIATLAATGYDIQEFVVSPHQLGVPYSRPRYFALAVRLPLRFPHRYDRSRGPVEHPPALGTSQYLRPSADSSAVYNEAGNGGTAGVGYSPKGVDACEEWPASPSWPGAYDAGPTPGLDAVQQYSRTEPAASSLRPSTLSTFLSSASPGHWTKGAGPGTGGATGASSEVNDTNDPWVAYALPTAQLAKFWRVLDVVTPSSTYCNCFTKHYADNLLGAGSVLATEEFAARYCVKDARGRLHFAAAPPLPPAALQPSSPAPASAGDAVSNSGEPDVNGGGGAAMSSGATGDEAACGAGCVPVVWRARPASKACNGGRRGWLGHGIVRAANGEGIPPRATSQVTMGPGGGGTAKGMPELLQPGSQGGRGRGTHVQGQAHQQAEQGDEAAQAVVLGLRFFTPAEVAAIHGLPLGWMERATAAGVQPRQQYGLLGNGLSTDVAAYLLQYLFEAAPDVL